MCRCVGVCRCECVWRVCVYECKRVCVCVSAGVQVCVSVCVASVCMSVRVCV